MFKKIIAWFKSLFRVFRNKSGQFKLPWSEDYTIHSVERITSEKQHAWINTSIGLIRKEIKNIPNFADLISQSTTVILK